jgi:hypothetical protein
MSYIQQDPKYKRIGRRFFLNNHYILLENWIFKSKILVSNDFENNYLKIEKHDEYIIIIVKKGFEWNGASFIIDFKNVIPGTIIHDAIYHYLHEISQYLNIPIKNVRKYADDVFNEINKHYNLWKPIRLLYYTGVRWLGGIFS